VAEPVAATPDRAALGALGSARRYGEAVRAAARSLSAGSATPLLDAQLLLAAACGVSRSSVLAFPERELTVAAGERFAAAVARRAQGEPLAYLVGERDFFSLTLRVAPAVLVPRSETEHLVEEALARLPAPAPERGSRAAEDGAPAAEDGAPAAEDGAPAAEDGAPAAQHEAPARVLDLGTGSGAIALAIKRQRPDVDIVGADVSPEALAVARANGERLGLEVRWVVSDWFAGLDGRRFDLILCNPPYVRSGDPHFDGALRFEPRGALDGGPDGLDAVRRVLAGAPRHLESEGALLLEHGYDQRQEIAALAAAQRFEVTGGGRDLAGLDRYLVLRRAG